MAKKVNKHEEKLYLILQHLFPEVIVQREYRFDIPKEGEKQRKWRFDFAYPDIKLAIEVEGGIWLGGRHVHPIGFSKDCEKYNAAAKQGWRVFRLVPQMISLDYVRELLL